MPRSLPYHLKPPEKYVHPPAQSSHYPCSGKSLGIFQKVPSSWSPPLAFLDGWSFHLVTMLGGATQKVPVIGSQLLDLHFGNHSCLCSWGPLGKQNALPTPCGYGMRGAPECGGGFEAAEQASHWLNAGTPTPMVLPGSRFEI